MTILALLSIFIGYLIKDLYLGIWVTPLYYKMFIHPNNSYFINTEFSLNTYIKLLSLITSIILCIILCIMLIILYELYKALHNGN